MKIDYCDLEYQIRNLKFTLSHLYSELDYLIALEASIDDIDELRWEIDQVERELDKITCYTNIILL